MTTEDFEAVQALRLTRRKTSPLQRMQRTSKRDYLLSKILHCGVCGRKMESTFNNGRPHYRCRYPAEYAEANGIQHPRTVYVREDHIVPRLDKWLCKIFAPHRIADTVKTLADASTGGDDNAILADAARKDLAAADRKLGQYRALLEAGTDPATVAGWIREVEIEKIAITARVRQLAGRAIMTAEDMTAIVHALGDLVKVLAQAAPADKMKIYKEPGCVSTTTPTPEP
ncbi:MAG: recombinase zinc beta ribbon domain-containing protein [Catenulispora sp.]